LPLFAKILNINRRYEDYELQAGCKVTSDSSGYVFSTE